MRRRSFVIIENDWQDVQFLTEELQRVFVGSIITCFKTAGDFLNAFESLSRVDVIIIEHFLPLLTPSLKNEDGAEHEALLSLFPDVVSSWNYQEAGERLVRFVRKDNDNTPIIIYTGSDVENIAVDVMKIPNVEYCLKQEDINNLIHVIRKVLSVRV